MRPHSSLLAVAGFALLGAVVLGVTLPSLGERVPTEDPSVSEVEAAGVEVADGPRGPTLAGAGREEVSEPPIARVAAPRRLEGTLRALDGTPLEGGTVYLVPKERQELDRRRKVSGGTSVSTGGRWVYPHRSAEAAPPSPEGCWVAGRARGYYPAFVDGDAWNGEPIALRLKPGRRVEIRARTEDGRTPPGAWAQVWTASGPGREVQDYPGPTDPAAVHEHGRFAPDGSLTLIVGTDDPVWVAVRCPGFYGEPESRLAPPDAGPLEFELQPSCTIRMTPVDDRSGEAIASPSVHVVRQGGRPLEGEPHKDTRVPGDYVRDGLRPGTYLVEIASPPYHTWRSEPIRITEPAQTFRLLARLVLNPNLGTLRVTLPLPVERSSPSEPVHVVMRQEGADGPWTWRGGYFHDAGTATIEVQHLPSGSYDVIGWVGRTRMVGLARGVEIGPEDVAEVSLQVGPGVEVTLSRRAPPGQDPVHVELRAPHLGRLPHMYLLRGGTRLEVDAVVPGGVTLGPYPVDEVTAQETRKGEAPLVRTVVR